MAERPGRAAARAAGAFRTSAKQAYTILWVTRELDWAGNLAYLNMINASFAPAKA